MMGLLKWLLACLSGVAGSLIKLVLGITWKLMMLPLKIMLKIMLFPLKMMLILSCLVLLPICLIWWPLRKRKRKND